MRGFAKRSVHDQVPETVWETTLRAKAEGLSHLKTSPNSSPNCAPKGLQIVPLGSAYSTENKRTPDATGRLLTEGL
jgi:hypothetical protein